MNVNAQGESIETKLDVTNEKLETMVDEIKKSNKHFEIMFWTAFFIGEIMAGIAIIFTIRNSEELSKQTENIQTQADNKARVDSANLLFSLSKRIYADFSKTVDLIRDADSGKPVVFHWDKMDKFLGELELVALLVRTPVVHREHAYEMFSSLIDDVFNNRKIVDYIQLARKDDRELFSGLIWLKNEFEVVKLEHAKHYH